MYRLDLVFIGFCLISIVLTSAYASAQNDEVSDQNIYSKLIVAALNNAKPNLNANGTRRSLNGKRRVTITETVYGPKPKGTKDVLPTENNIQNNDNFTPVNRKVDRQEDGKGEEVPNRELDINIGEKNGTFNNSDSNEKLCGFDDALSVIVETMNLPNDSKVMTWNLLREFVKILADLIPTSNEMQFIDVSILKSLRSPETHRDTGYFEVIDTRTLMKTPETWVYVAMNFPRVRHVYEAKPNDYKSDVDYQPNLPFTYQPSDYEISKETESDSIQSDLRNTPWINENSNEIQAKSPITPYYLYSQSEDINPSRSKDLTIKYGSYDKNNADSGMKFIEEEPNYTDNENKISENHELTPILNEPLTDADIGVADTQNELHSPQLHSPEIDKANENYIQNKNDEYNLKSWIYGTDPSFSDANSKIHNLYENQGDLVPTEEPDFEYGGYSANEDTPTQPSRNSDNLELEPYNVDEWSPYKNPKGRDYNWIVKESMVTNEEFPETIAENQGPNFPDYITQKVNTPTYTEGPISSESEDSDTTPEKKLKPYYENGMSNWIHSTEQASTEDFNPIVTDSIANDDYKYYDAYNDYDDDEQYVKKHSNVYSPIDVPLQVGNGEIKLTKPTIYELDSIQNYKKKPDDRNEKKIIEKLFPSDKVERFVIDADGLIINVKDNFTHSRIVSNLYEKNQLVAESSKVRKHLIKIEHPDGSVDYLIDKHVDSQSNLGRRHKVTINETADLNDFILNNQNQILPYSPKVVDNLRDIRQHKPKYIAHNYITNDFTGIPSQNVLKSQHSVQEIPVGLEDQKYKNEPDTLRHAYTYIPLSNERDYEYYDQSQDFLKLRNNINNIGLPRDNDEYSAQSHLSIRPLKTNVHVLSNADGYDKLNNFETPRSEFYIYNQNTNNEYHPTIDNSEEMSRSAKVTPVIASSYYLHDSFGRIVNKTPTKPSNQKQRNYKVRNNQMLRTETFVYGNPYPVINAEKHSVVHNHYGTQHPRNVERH